MVTCICTCVGYFLGFITKIGEYLLKPDPLHALFMNDHDTH